jgi:glyoxylase-like metal-dependent hydrolase (beta-lactamase superfamily II)
VYSIEILIPTSRFVFSVEGERVEVLQEHRSPEAFDAYARWRRERSVVGMTTFPNSVVLRGAPTILVDPGLHLQNEPILGALRTRDLDVGDVGFVALTHAHSDHSEALLDLPLPVALHEREIGAPHWPAVEGVLRRRELRVLKGREGELAPGVRWALTPGHTAGGVSYAVDTVDGVVVLCGDIIGPSRAEFDAMTPTGQDARELLRSWELIRSWNPVRVIAGHLPPFAP